MSTGTPATPLPTRRLGDSEPAVSVVGLGCNNFGRRLDLDETAAVLEAALDAGITFFDTADIYGGAGASEELMGRALEDRGIEMIDVAIGGLAAQPAVASVIAGATKPEQIRSNVGAARWEASAEDLAELDRVAPTPRG
jgi:aryl-alcohol dehydrogenase-like predicted oxidoreductase